MEEPKELLIGFTKDTDGNWVLNIHKDYEITVEMRDTFYDNFKELIENCKELL